KFYTNGQLFVIDCDPSYGNVNCLDAWFSHTHYNFVSVLNVLFYYVYLNQLDEKNFYHRLHKESWLHKFLILLSQTHTTLYTKKSKRGGGESLQALKDHNVFLIIKHFVRHNLNCDVPHIVFDLESSFSVFPNGYLNLENLNPLLCIYDLKYYSPISFFLILSHIL